MTRLVVDPALVERFRKALLRLIGEKPDRLALAVSGGPDSLALLLLAHAATDGNVAAATVDHGLRAEAAAEAAAVGTLCYRLDVPHVTLTVPAREAAILRSSGNRQALAREWRFGLLRGWCAEGDMRFLLTAHHADDQAETLLMRLARGAGVAGLSGIRPRLSYPRSGGTTSDPAEYGFTIVRPLLGFLKAELLGICSTAGITPADDPSNDDPAYDRTHARRLLAEAEWIDVRRVAAAADHLGDAERALEWATKQEADRRRQPGNVGEGRLVFDLACLPKEIKRRIVTDAIVRVTQITAREPSPARPRGPDIQRLIDAVIDGKTATLGSASVSRRGDIWSIRPAPPRRTH